MEIKHSLTQFSSCLWSHKAITIDRHCCLSFAFFPNTPQLTPSSRISFSTVRPQVFFGLPLALFPGGVQCMVTLEMAGCSILRTWPIQRHLLFFISELILLVEVVRCNSSFEMTFGQKMFRIRRKQLLNMSSL